MSPMLVLRWENEDGEGPFSGTPKFDGCFDTSPLKLASMPLPYCDGLGYLNHSYSYAFLAKHYRKWRNRKDRSLLTRAGYQLKRIMVAHAIVGRNQVAFHEDARID